MLGQLAHPDEKMAINSFPSANTGKIARVNTENMIVVIAICVKYVIHGPHSFQGDNNNHRIKNILMLFFSYSKHKDRSCL